MSTRRYVIAFFVGLLVAPACLLGSHFAFAQSEVERLQNQISEKNDRLSQIEKEIAQYEAALQEVGAEKSTLQSAIEALELERGKLQADIRYTENQISSTDLTINKLSFEITSAEEDILHNKEAIREILRSLNIADDESLIEILLRHENISEFWNAVEELERVRSSMAQKVESLSLLKEELSGKRQENTEQREELVDLKEQISDQQSILAQNQQQKNELLEETENEEAQYQALLAQKEQAREQLMAEVRDIESQLQFILDPNTIPSAGTAVFQWPIANPVITQYFGYTKFALTTAAYKNNLHNGMDIGAPIGTKIHAPLSGTVRSTGNTDLVPGCYSWGKWALVDHPNGLSSLFAHMSQIAVTPGQTVDTGDIIGYVGSTGYSTGPHLHFTVYVSDGVQVMQFNQFKKVTGCGSALSPFAAVEAYLDPLDYLPPL